MLFYRVEHRGYSASLIDKKMTIRDWNGDIVARDPIWKYSYTDQVEAKLKEAIDDFIRLAPFMGKGWWKA